MLLCCTSVANQKYELSARQDHRRAIIFSEDDVAGHSAACQGSGGLCDALFEALRIHIPELKRSPSKQWCSVFKAGKKRLAYVTHFKTEDRIQVWCRGEPAKLKAEPGLAYHERKSTDSGWGATFRGRFDVSDLKAIPAAADVLVRHSYSRS